MGVYASSLQLVVNAANAQDAIRKWGKWQIEGAVVPDHSVKYSKHPH
tara:strand:- start:630 stop:770 length:141 start_codon:yes stop_codon:yes gene_type:complete